MAEKDIRNLYPPPGKSTKSHPYRSLSQEADILVPRPSILLPTLQETEKKFFELVAAGKIEIIRYTENIIYSHLKKILFSRRCNIS